MTFERQDDAEGVMAVLGKRMGRFGLTLDPVNTDRINAQRHFFCQESASHDVWQ